MYAPKSSSDGHCYTIDAANMLWTDRVIDKEANSSETCCLCYLHEAHAYQQDSPKHASAEIQTSTKFK